MLVRASEVSKLDQSSRVCKRVRDILKQEWSCRQNVLFHALDHQKTASVIQDQLRSKANYLLKGGTFQSTTAAGSAGISFTFNHHSNFSFRRSQIGREGGVLCFPLQTVLGSKRHVTLPDSGGDTYEALLLHDDIEAEKAVLKSVLANFEIDGPAVFGQGNKGYFEKISEGRSLLEQSKHEALQIIRKPDRLRARINDIYDGQPDLSENELTHLYQRQITRLTTALDNPLGLLVSKPPETLLAASEAARTDEERSGSLTIQKTCLFLAKNELNKAFLNRGKSLYLLKINTLRSMVPHSLLKRGRDHIEEGIPDKPNTQSVQHALHKAVEQDEYKVLWNAALHHVLRSRNLQPITNLSAQGCQHLWKHTYEVIRRVSREHLGSAALSVQTKNCIALLQEECDEAIKQAVREKSIPTVLYNPDKERTASAQNQYLFSLFCQLLGRAGLSYQGMEMSDDAYKAWLRNTSIIPKTVEDGEVTAYERRVY